MGTNDSAALLPYMAVFVRVVEAGSFSGAARLLGSTPSAVSRQVARLEQALALRLLERTTRQLRLNEAGAEFYQHCRDMLDAADAAVAIGERLMRSPRGLVRLSVPKAYGKFVVGPLMPAFLQRYPEVDVQLRISDQSPDLIEDGFDLLVQVTDNPPEGLAGKPLGPVRQLLCASPDYLQRHGEPQHPQDLLRHSCLYLGKRRETIAGTCAAASNRNGDSAWPLHQQPQRGAATGGAGGPGHHLPAAFHRRPGAGRRAVARSAAAVALHRLLPGRGLAAVATESSPAAEDAGTDRLSERGADSQLSATRTRRQ